MATRRYSGSDDSSRTTRPDSLRRRRAARDIEPVQQRRPEIEERPGDREAAERATRGTLSVEDLTVAALPFLLGLMLLLIGLGPGVVKLGS